jgi:hypothetical protein
MALSRRKAIQGVLAAAVNIPLGYARERAIRLSAPRLAIDGLERRDDRRMNRCS